jgi:DNA-binding NtrC family response regulator
MSETLLESQLFGHERGAFTGAVRSVRGKFELADEGTLFLDEIADMSPLAQAKILRAVEYGEFERLGSETLRRANARIIAATNSRLRERVDARQFREDLYHRLKGLTVTIPPLRERAEDLPLLIASELRRSAAQLGKHVTQIEPAAMNRLLRHPWPGNLRELHHTLRTLVLFVDRGVVTLDHVLLHEQVEDQHPTAPEARIAPPASPLETAPPAARDDLTLAAALQRHVRQVYEACQGRQREAARRLGISRSTLVRHLKRLPVS